jgi:arabinan endo-1,5-alpha-L-arabinosidase
MKRRHRAVLVLVALVVVGTLLGHASGELPVRGSIREARDPSVIYRDGTFYLFSTGHGIPIRCSEDLVQWRGCGLVFFGLPGWAREHVLGATAIWAPDIAYFNDRYHLYYSISTFGSNVSAIGLATNTTLDRSDPEHRWIDHGIVIKSTGVEHWNAIDPNVILTPDGAVWMVFGSFWSGVKMFELDPGTGMALEPAPTLISVASRAAHPRAVEAPFIVHHADHYYLFVSFDQCCQGERSTYNIRVGRSEHVTGPYVDRDGVDLMEGGGTLLVGPTTRFPGSGHNAVLLHEGTHYLVYHGYDAHYGGSATLRIETLSWDAEGWPQASWSPDD